jgi:cell division protein FtsB
MRDRQRDGKSAAVPGGAPAAPGRRRSAIAWVVALAAMALVVDGIAGERGWVANRRDRQMLEQAERQLQEKRLENARIRDLARRLRDQDPATIEDIARRDLGYIAPGETVFIVRDAPSPTKK